MGIKTMFFSFLLFLYMNYIKEDWDVLTKLGVVFIKPAWFVKTIITILFSPLFIIPFLLNNKIDVEISKLINE